MSVSKMLFCSQKRHTIDKSQFFLTIWRHSGVAFTILIAQHTHILMDHLSQTFVTFLSLLHEQPKEDLFFCVNVFR